MKKYILLVLAILLIFQIQSVAQILSFNKENNRVLFQTQNGSMIVSVCTDNIIEVKYAATTTVPAKTSLAVIKNWEAVPFDVTESTGAITLKTSKLSVVVTKMDATVGFFTPDGTLILQEDSKEMTAQTISGLPTNRCASTFKSPSNEAIYGLGQHQQGIMNYKGYTQTLEQANMEIALPVILSNKGYGLMWDNYSRTVFYGNITSSTKYKFESEAGDQVDYYFFYGPDPDSIIAAYRNATGTVPLFPKWAYGLFQSMDKYEKSSDLLNVGSKYRKNRIPLDCIVQDWDYWTPNAWGSHKMNAVNYPNPSKLIDSLHIMNLHSMISIWPIFTEGDANYNEMNAINAIYPSSGKRHYYDPHNEQARLIYWRQVKENLFGKYGWDAWWADGDEPDNWPDAYDRKLANTALGKGVLYYNTYPLLHTSSIYDGWRNDITSKRLFTLSRSAFLGQQRNAAASWSGDIQSSWVDFKKQLSAGLNFSMSGIPYWTTDIGGYWGTDWTTSDNRELFTRWFEYGVFCPIFRIHGKLERTLYSETSWDAVTRNTLLKYDKLRYRLMPYIYSLAWKVTNEHYTIMRHLIMDYPNDSKVFNISNQFLFGPFIMVNPIADKGVVSRSVYFPDGIWYDFWTGDKNEGGATSTVNAPLDRMPLFVKAGSIIPMGPEIEYALEKTDPIEIRVYRGANGSFNIYDDAGDTYGYEQGAHSVIPLSYDEAGQELTIGNRQGSFPNMLQNRTFKIVWVSTGRGAGVELPVTCDTLVAYSGSEIKLKFNPDKTFPKTHYEAEEATLSNGVTSAAAFKGFMGTGYVTGFSELENRSVSFDVNVKETGNYVVKLRYSAPNSSINPLLSLNSNELKITDLICEKTVSGNSWNEVAYILYLKTGNNTISYSSESANINLDCIDISLPSESKSLDTNLKKVTRIKLQNSNLYLEENNSSIGLAEKNNNLNGQIWTIEKTNGKYYKITSSITKKTLTVKDASNNEGALVELVDYSGTTNQQWLIDEFGYDLTRINVLQSQKSLSVVSGQLVQNTDQSLSTQRWILENPVTPGNGNGLLGEYYNGTNFTTLIFKRTDEQINFNWGLNSPGSTISTDLFSIRWTGKILPQFTDEYTFYTRSDDGVRLWVNDKQIINDWNARALKENSGKITLEANAEYNIKLDYFDNAYDAIVSLEWSCPSLERQLIAKSQLFSEMPSGILSPTYSDNLGINIYPNPTNINANIEFQLDRPSLITFDILTLQGMLVKSSIKKLTHGLQLIVMDVSDLKTGLYIVKLSSNNFIGSKILFVK